MATYWVRSFCICCLLVFLAPIARASSGLQLEEQTAHDVHAHKSSSSRLQPQDLKKVKKNLSNLDYGEGDYTPSPNVDPPTAPPPLVARRLLRHYNPVATTTSQLPQRKLLQDYTPNANDRSPGTPTQHKRLLQDYSPIPNYKDPSPPPQRRKLLQDYSPTTNRRVPSSNRRLLQDYSPMSNERGSSEDSSP
ncbi:hypothetical protein L7F22_025315 [Adiantum nelumboides]|nr:hypothetical protein [Adiantum nelumboides]